MQIDVLGRGCHDCDETVRNAERAVHDLGLDAVVVRIWRLADVARYDVPRPTALAIDGHLICSGRTMCVLGIKNWLRRGRDAACPA